MVSVRSMCDGHCCVQAPVVCSVSFYYSIYSFRCTSVCSPTTMMRTVTVNWNRSSEASQRRPTERSTVIKIEQKKKWIILRRRESYEFTFHAFSLDTVSEDPYYCGLSARVPKFDRSVVPLKKSNKNQNVISVPKRMSVAYLQHPLVFAASGNTNYQYPMKPQQQKQYAKQKNLVMPQKNYQQMMWHARSMESGLGKSR